MHAEDGYDVDYLRVPVTDEKAPKDHDFELLIQVGEPLCREREPAQIKLLPECALV